jgi:Ca2+-binding RTX toxin-like protein
MATTLNLTHDDHFELENWLSTFIQAMTLKEVELLYRAEATISMTANIALKGSAANIGVLGALATAYVNHVRINDTTEGMSPLFVNAKSTLSSGILIFLSATSTAAIGAGFIAAATPGAQPLAAPLWLAGGLLGLFAASLPRVQELLDGFVDYLAEYAIAEFGPIAQDLLLQSEFIWGTEDDNTLIAMNPHIVQHLHGVDGENTLIGSDGRNFFYGGPQKDIIQT